MLRKANNKFFAAVAEGTVLASALPAEGAVVTSANLPAGAVTITDLGLVRLSEAALVALGANDQFIIVQGKGANAPLLKSDVLTKGSISITSNKHVAAVQQITVIGYNGTSGNMPSANDTSYYIKLRKNDNDAANRSQPLSLTGQYKTGGAATVTEVAFGIARNLRANMDDEPANGYLSIEVLSNGTITALPNDAVVVSGSRTVTSTAHLLSVGDFVNLAGATYQVKVVQDANTIILSTPYVGASATITAGTTLATQAGSVATITSAGVRLTGVAADFDVNAFRDYYVNRFTASFSDSDTLVTSVQGAREGVGVWQKVAMDEYMTYGFEGQNEMLSVPPRMRDQEVVNGAKYSAVQIAWTEDIGTLVTSHGASGSVILYAGLNGSNQLPATTAAGKAADLLGAIAVPGFASTDLNE